MGAAESCLRDAALDVEVAVSEAVGGLRGCGAPPPALPSPQPSLRSAPRSRLRSTQAERERSWRATGLVSLRDGQLRELPPSLFALASGVRTLDAANNRLASLPAQFACLDALQRLVLSGNALAALPPLAPALGGSLKVLLLDGNRIGRLPAAPLGLGRLERLSLAGNGLAELPGAALQGLPALRSLDLSRNALRALPDELGDCGALEELDVTSNGLEALPAALGRLLRLRSLLADGNRLRTLPPELLTGCALLSNLQLHEQSPPLHLAALRELPGWVEVEKRTMGRNAKRVQGGVLIGARGLDDGLDHSRLPNNP